MNDAGKGTILQRSQLLEETVHYLLGDDHHLLFRQAYSKLMRWKEKLDNWLGCRSIPMNDETIEQAFQIVKYFDSVARDIASCQTGHSFTT